MRRYRSILEGEAAAPTRALVWLGLIAFALSGWVALIVAIVSAFVGPQAL